MIQENRLISVDILKGILIMLMVIGHTNSPITPTIYLFHMACFLMISGYLYKEKYSIINYIKRQIKTCIIPYFIINIFFILIANFLNKFFSEKIFETIPSIKNLALHLNTVDIGGATWFLIVLFYSSILSSIFIKNRDRFNLKYSLIILLILTIIIQINSIYLPYLLDLSFIGSFFFLLGFIIKENNLITKERNMGGIFFFKYFDINLF